MTRESSGIQLGVLFLLTLMLSGCSWISVKHCAYWNVLPALGIAFYEPVCPGGMPPVTERPKIEPIRMEVSPRVSVQPTDVHLRVWIEPDDQNRSLVVTASSENFYRSTAESLDGVNARRVRDIWWSRVPCGEYGFLAAVFDQAGKTRHQVSESAVFCPQYGL